MVSVTGLLGGTRGGDTASAQLRMWEEILSGQGLKHALLVLMWTRLIWLFPPFFACTVIKTFTSAEVTYMLKGVCGIAIMYSSGTTAFLFGFRRQRLLDVLARARQLCEQGEQRLPDNKATLAAARSMRLFRILGFVYIKTSCSLAALEQFADSPSIPLCFPMKNSPWGRIVVAWVESAKWCYLATSFFTTLMVMLTLLLAAECQCLLLRARLVAARGHHEVLECARHYRDILLLEDDMRDFYYHALLHVLAGALFVPLINTYQIVFEERTMFSMLTLSTLPIAYGTTSLLGDRLAVAGQQVAFAAYGGPWPGEDVHTVRLRTMLMQASSRPAPFSMSGLGGFTRTSCYRVLKAWYQYLNLLIGCVQ